MKPSDIAYTRTRTPAARRGRCFFILLLGIGILICGNTLTYMGVFGLSAVAEPVAEHPLIRLDRPGDGLMVLHLVQYEFGTEDDDTVRGRGFRLLRAARDTSGPVPVRYVRFLPQVNLPERGLVPAGITSMAGGALLTLAGLFSWRSLCRKHRRMRVAILDGVLTPVRRTSR